MAPKRKAAAKAAAVKAWSNHNQTEEAPTEAMPATGRSTRTSKRNTAAEPAQQSAELITTQPEPKKARAGRRTKAVESAPVEEPVEAAPEVEEAAPAPPPRKTRGRAASNTSVEEAPVVSKPTRSTRGKKAVPIAPEDDTIPAPTVVEAITRARGKKLASAAVHAKVKELEPEPVVEEVVEQPVPAEPVATKPKRGGRGKKVVEVVIEEPPASVVEEVVGTAEPAPARSTRATRGKKQVEQIVEQKQEELELIVAEPPKSKRSTRGKKTEPAPVVEEPEVQAQPEPEQPPKRTRRGKKAAEPAPEPIPEPTPEPVIETAEPEPIPAAESIVDDVKPQETAAEQPETPEEVEEPAPAPKATRRGRAKATPITTTAPTRPTRGKRNIKEVEVETEAPATKRRNTKRTRRDSTPEPIAEQAAQLEDPVTDVQMEEPAEQSAPAEVQTVSEMQVDEVQPHEPETAEDVAEDVIAEKAPEEESLEAEMTPEVSQPEQTVTKDEIIQIEIVQEEVIITEEKIEIEAEVEVDEAEAVTAVDQSIVMDEASIEPEDEAEQVVLEEPDTTPAEALDAEQEEETAEEVVEEEEGEVVEKEKPLTASVLMEKHLELNPRTPVRASPKKSVSESILPPTPQLQIPETVTPLTPEVAFAISPESVPDIASPKATPSPVARTVENSLIEQAIVDNVDEGLSDNQDVMTEGSDNEVSMQLRQEQSEYEIDSSFGFDNMEFLDNQDQRESTPTSATEQDGMVFAQEEQEAHNEMAHENSDIDMLDIDSSFLMEQEMNQTPEKRGNPEGFFGADGNTVNPSALAPLSPAAVNAGHGSPSDLPPFSNPYEKPGESSKQADAPMQTPVRNNVFSMGSMSASRGYSYSHLSYVPRNPSPLRQQPLIYSPSEATATPPPRRRRPVVEGLFPTRPGDPSPLRPEEISNYDFSDGPDKSPVVTRGTSRRVSAPVTRGRSRSRSVRRESSPLKNAVDFSVQDSNEAAEGGAKPQTPKITANPFQRVGGHYDPNQEISELREDELHLTPALGTPQGNILDALQSPAVGSVASDEEGTDETLPLYNPNGTVTTVESDMDKDIINPAFLDMLNAQDTSFPEIHGGSLLAGMSFEISAANENLENTERILATPPQENDSDIPMSSPMATPMPTRRMVLPVDEPEESPVVEQDSPEKENDAPPVSEKRRSQRQFGTKRTKTEVRHSTGSLEHVKNTAQGNPRRSTLSGPIDVTAGSSRDTKHPRAEARSAYLGPPPTMTIDDYQNQFKSSVIGAPSGLDNTNSPAAVRAETMSPIMMEELIQNTENPVQSDTPKKRSGIRRFGMDGADDSPEPSPTEEKYVEMTVKPMETARQTAKPAPEDLSSEESALSDAPSDLISSDATSDETGLETIHLEQPTSLGTVSSPAPAPSKVEQEPKRRISDPSSKPERKSRIPLMRPGSEGSNNSPFSARMNRVSHTKNLSDRELSKVTARNTTRNGVYKQSKFERKVIRLPGTRPPSPSREIQSAAAEESRNKRKRVFEETGIALGPGDDTDYTPPEISPSAKRVKWHGQLEYEFDDNERSRFQTDNGILAPERVRSDPNMIHEVTIQKFLYEGERDIFDEDFEE